MSIKIEWECELTFYRAFSGIGWGSVTGWCPRTCQNYLDSIRWRIKYRGRQEWLRRESHKRTTNFESIYVIFQTSRESCVRKDDVVCLSKNLSLNWSGNFSRLVSIYFLFRTHPHRIAGDTSKGFSVQNYQRTAIYLVYNFIFPEVQHAHCHNHSHLLRKSVILITRMILLLETRLETWWYQRPEHYSKVRYHSCCLADIPGTTSKTGNLLVSWWTGCTCMAS